MNQLFGLQHRGDRYLSLSSRHTQVPVPATNSGGARLSRECFERDTHL